MPFYLYKREKNTHTHQVELFEYIETCSFWTHNTHNCWPLSLSLRRWLWMLSLLLHLPCSHWHIRHCMLSIWKWFHCVNKHCVQRNCYQNQIVLQSLCQSNQDGMRKKKFNLNDLNETGKNESVLFNHFHFKY